MTLREGRKPGELVTALESPDVQHRIGDAKSCWSTAGPSVRRGVSSDTRTKSALILRRSQNI